MPCAASSKDAFNVKSVIATRQDNNGDVLLAGPALRALRAGCDRLTLVCGPRGEAAAKMLPCVDEVVVWEAAWIDADPRPVQADDVDSFVCSMRRGFDEAVIFTSFHQSPLPMALLLRMAGVERIGAISVDYPGSLLDVRHHVEDDIHEVQRALSLANAMGYQLPPGDDARLAMRPLPNVSFGNGYVVVHPGCTVPARAWSLEGNRALVELLTESGFDVVVTGSADERELAKAVAGTNPRVRNAAGSTTFAEFAAIVREAAVVVCGNTAATHVSSAAGTPVVEIFPPTIPAARFRPWMVPYVLLGDQEISCAGCRAHSCPIPGQPCLRDVTPEAVLDAVRSLVPRMVAA